MAYIGTPPSNAFTSLLKQDFSTSATTGYTLDHAVNNANDIALFINFVRQEPTAAYSASGTTLTLTSATASSDDMYCVYLGQALQTVNPPNASVGTAQLVNDAVDNTKLDLSDDYTFTGKISGQNYPAFEARLNSSQATDHNTATKIQCGNEIFDTNSAYDNSTNYRFTPQVAGKYFCYFGLRAWAGGSASDGTRFLYIQPYKNGSLIRNYASVDTDGNEIRAGSVTASAVIEFNGSSDYLEFYGLIYAQNGLNPGVQFLNDQTYFGAYRIGD